MRPLLTLRKVWSARRNGPVGARAAVAAERTTGRNQSAELVPSGGWFRRRCCRSVRRQIRSAVRSHSKGPTYSVALPVSLSDCTGW
jgi:hypothetical protein